MKIKIICVGKLKEKYLKDGISEYIKRLSRFCKTEIIELNDEKIPDNASKAEEDIVIKNEGEKILKHIQKGEYVISLCVEGKSISSTGLAEKINEITLSGLSTITLIIGGSLGIDDKIKNLSDFKLSFSKMTFPHQLMRLILLEQIYRAFKINANEEYHK
ncbi:MAG: 23S rRNA (pseudouridine(1915)-N(3))-methyltransferase RlmH [Ruminococcaceae bacterium]|nr:23S rRNA (pseudouridine(1915)-N(3))-methyltransferase RlmH [Oscillospiraceae bacterium]